MYQNHSLYQRIFEILFSHLAAPLPLNTKASFLHTQKMCKDLCLFILLRNLLNLYDLGLQEGESPGDSFCNLKK